MKLVGGQIVDTGQRETVWIEAVEPIPLKERWPGKEDCNDRGRCWMGRASLAKDGTWTWEFMPPDDFLLTHWLPASVQLLPARVEG